MATLMDNNGYFIPFNQPVVAPASLISDAPLTCVTFNEAWLPLITGALKVLARPETYKDGNFTPIESAHEGHDLLGRIGDCPAIEELIPNWLIGYTTNVDAGYSSLIPVYSSLVKVKYYAIAAYNSDPLNQNSDIYIYGADSNGSAGGKIDILIDVYPSGRVYEVNTVDCLNVSNSYTDVTSGTSLALSYTNMKIVQVIFLNTPFYFATVKLTDDAVCSNA